MSNIINESQELSQFSGTVKIDTSNGGVTLFMKSSPKSGSVLKITKVSRDDKIVALYSEHSLINGAEITVFGFDKKAKSISLKSDGNNWNIIKE